MFILFSLFIIMFLMVPPAAAAELLTLPDVLRIALTDHPLIAAWEARVRAGEGNLLAARAYPNPEIGGGFGRITRFGGGNEGSLELSQPLEVLSKRKHRRQAAEMDLKSLSYEREALKLDLIFQVKQAFYALLWAEKNLQVAQDNERSARSLLSSAQVRVEVGEAPEFERIKAQVEVARAANEVRKAVTQVSLAKAALNTLMGRPSLSPLEVVGELESVPRELPLDSLLQRALEGHPLLQQHRYLVQKQQRLLDLAKSSRYPDPKISGFYEREPDREVAGIGLSLPLPIWYRQRGEILSAAAEVARAEAELAQLKNETGRSVTEAHRRYLIARDLITVFTDQLLKQAEESRRIAETSYREGASGILDLIEAQRTARQTFLDYQQALYELKVAEAALERATGEVSL